MSAEFAGRRSFRDDGGDLRGGGPQRVRDHDLDREGFEFRIGQSQERVEFWREDGGDGLRFKRARKAISKSMELLADFPWSCRKASHDNPFIRELVISFVGGGYVALFEIDDAKNITILAIRNQREDDFT